MLFLVCKREFSLIEEEKHIFFFKILAAWPCTVAFQIAFISGQFTSFPLSWLCKGQVCVLFKTFFREINFTKTMGQKQSHRKISICCWYQLWVCRKKNENLGRYSGRTYPQRQSKYIFTFYSNREAIWLIKQEDVVMHVLSFRSKYFTWIVSNIRYMTGWNAYHYTRTDHAY